MWLTNAFNDCNFREFLTHMCEANVDDSNYYIFWPSIDPQRTLIHSSISLRRVRYRIRSKEFLISSTALLSILLWTKFHWRSPPEIFLYIKLGIVLIFFKLQQCLLLVLLPPRSTIHRILFVFSHYRLAIKWRL